MTLKEVSAMGIFKNLKLHSDTGCICKAYIHPDMSSVMVDNRYESHPLPALPR